ncbi:hypothetical protein IEI95_008275 [Agrobacterium vitis]|uniref:Uncharacterized protein n=1 Tax=Agrobacterium vitis TaxID=373 RepID=A0AAE2R9L4_AGRVI|nr:hypothetical protein [Agrobacterium vitis]
MFSIQVGSSTFRHFLIFGGQPFADVMDWLAPASIGICNASRNCNIERRKPFFPVPQSYEFPCAEIHCMICNNPLL